MRILKALFWYPLAAGMILVGVGFAFLMFFISKVDQEIMESKRAQVSNEIG